MKYQPSPFLKHLDVKLECLVRLDVMVAVSYFIEMPEFFVFTSDFQLVTGVNENMHRVALASPQI